MNRSDFLRMIETSGPSDRTAISEVNELINIFPYFQSAYLLLLKGLNNTADVRFENQLKASALNLADREVLYYLLKKEPVADAVPKTDTTVSVVTEPDNTESQQTVIEDARNSQEMIDEIEKENLRESPGQDDPDHTVIVSESPAGDDNDAAILVVDGETGEVEERVFYMDPGFSVSEPEELLELDPAGEEGGAPEAEEQAVAGKQLQSELIERFILANPRIEPSRERTGKPQEDLSTPYVEEQGEFVTETLAHIYIRQGYYSRALDIYEKLSLKFPEKSSYFATQIEKVKELLKK